MRLHPIIAAAAAAAVAVVVHVHPVCAQRNIKPGDIGYTDLPATDPNFNKVNPRSVGPGANLHTSICCPGGSPPTGCTGTRCYPRDCSQCNCNAQNLCPLPLPVGHGAGQTEGQINGKLRNIVRDPDLYFSLACLNQQDFGPSVLGGCGDSYDEARIPNKIKVFVNWVDDIGNSLTGQLSPSFPTHIGMARRYGVSDLEIQRMIAFIAPYVGFDKSFAGFGAWLGQYANCSILQPSNSAPGMLKPVHGQPVGVGSPLTGGCPVGQCHNQDYAYQDWLVDSYADTVRVAEKVVDFYRGLGYSELMVRELDRAWKLPNLSLKAKLYGVLTIDSQYRASAYTEIQGLTKLMIDEHVTTKDELLGFIDFSSCYTGYNRAQAEFHRLFSDGGVAPGSQPTSDTAGTIAITAVVTFFVVTIAMCGGFYYLHKKNYISTGDYQSA